MSRSLRTLLVSLAILFILGMLAREVVRIQPQLTAFGPAQVVPAAVAYLLFMVLMQLGLAEGWIAWLKVYDARLARSDAYRSFFVPALGKYLPGKVAFALGRIETVKLYGGNRAAGGFCFASENFFLLLMAALLSMPVIVAASKALRVHQDLIYTLAIPLWLSAIALWPVLLRMIAGVLRNRWNLAAPAVSPRFSTSFLFSLYYAVLWCIYGVAGCVLTVTLFEVDSSHYPTIVSAFVASWLVGYLSIITPGGLGVREGALVVFLGALLGTGEAAFLALLSRVLWTLAELGSVTAVLLQPRAAAD